MALCEVLPFLNCLTKVQLQYEFALYYLLNIYFRFVHTFYRVLLMRLGFGCTEVMCLCGKGFKLFGFRVGCVLNLSFRWACMSTIQKFLALFLSVVFTFALSSCAQRE